MGIFPHLFHSCCCYHIWRYLYPYTFWAVHCRSFVGNCLCIIEPNLYSSPLMTVHVSGFNVFQTSTKHTPLSLPCVLRCVILFIIILLVIQFHTQTHTHSRWFIYVYTPCKIRPLSTWTHTENVCMCGCMFVHLYTKIARQTFENRQPTHTQREKEIEIDLVVHLHWLTQTKTDIHNNNMYTFYQSYFCRLSFNDESRQAKRHKYSVYNW